MTVELSAPAHLVEGLSAALLFRVHMACPDWETLEVALRGCGPDVSANQRFCSAEGDIEIPLTVRPSGAGSVGAELSLSIQRSQVSEPEVWTATLMLGVVPSSRSTPLTINIHNEGDLAEISLGSLSGRLADAVSPADPLQALANPRVFTRIDALRLASSPKRLTLSLGDGSLLHLVSRSPAWFGRQGEHPEKGRLIDNAIRLWCLASDGSDIDGTKTLCISRTCFLVERDGPRCRIREGAPDRDEHGNILSGGPVSPTSCGVAVDGERLPPCGGVSLVAGAESPVVVVPDAGCGGALSLRLRALPAADAPAVCAGGLLTRDDGLGESYLVLWGEVDLGEVVPALRGHMIAWGAGTFRFRQSGGPALPLAAGATLGSSAVPVTAVPFRQLCL